MYVSAHVQEDMNAEELYAVAKIGSKISSVLEAVFSPTFLKTKSTAAKVTSITSSSDSLITEETLPADWKKEVKTRKGGGTPYPVFVAPDQTRHFSIVAVNRYLGLLPPVDRSNVATQRPRRPANRTERTSRNGIIFVPGAYKLLCEKKIADTDGVTWTVVTVHYSPERTYDKDTDRLTVVIHYPESGHCEGLDGDYAMSKNGTLFDPDDRKIESNTMSHAVRRKDNRQPLTDLFFACEHCGKVFMSEVGHEYHINKMVCRKAERAVTKRAQSTRLASSNDRVAKRKRIEDDAKIMSCINEVVGYTLKTKAGIEKKIASARPHRRKKYTFVVETMGDMNDDVCRRALTIHDIFDEVDRHFLQAKTNKRFVEALSTLKTMLPSRDAKRKRYNDQDEEDDDTFALSSSEDSEESESDSSSDQRDVSDEDQTIGDALIHELYLPTADEMFGFTTCSTSSSEWSRRSARRLKYQQNVVSRHCACILCCPDKGDRSVDHPLFVTKSVLHKARTKFETTSNSVRCISHLGKRSFARKRGNDDVLSRGDDPIDLLAVGRSDIDRAHLSLGSHTRASKGVIDIFVVRWEDGLIKSPYVAKPVLKRAMGLVHDTGVVLDVRWEPRDDRNEIAPLNVDSEHVPRAGRLAVVLGDGSACIVDVPEPSASTSSEGGKPVCFEITSMPYMMLRHESARMSTVRWNARRRRTPSSSRRELLTGSLCGTVLMWTVDDTSLLPVASMSRPLRPIRVFRFDSFSKLSSSTKHAVRCLDWCPHSVDGLFVAGYQSGEIRVWRREAPAVHLSEKVVPQRCVPFAIAWPEHAPPIVSCGNGNLYASAVDAIVRSTRSSSHALKPLLIACGSKNNALVRLVAVRNRHDETDRPRFHNVAVVGENGVLYRCRYDTQLPDLSRKDCQMTMKPCDLGTDGNGVDASPETTTVNTDPFVTACEVLTKLGPTSGRRKSSEEGFWAVVGSQSGSVWPVFISRA